MRHAECHPERKHAARGLCAKCHKRAWYERNRERLLAACAVRRCEKAAEISEYKKAWKKRRAEHVRANYQRWYTETRPERLRVMREARERDPAGRVACTREWRRANPERYAAQARAMATKRRARKLACPGVEPTQDEYASVRWLLGGRCYYCGECAADKIEIDHVVPLADGGSVGVENLVPACRSCNSSKSDKPVAEWLTAGRCANDSRFEPARRRHCRAA